MADFQLKVTAETQDAEKKLQNIDKTATEATRDRPIKIEIPNYSQLSKNLGDLKKDIGDAANTVKQFYRVAGQLPVGPVKDINEMGAQLKNVAVAANDTRKSVGDAGDVIRTTLDGAGKAAESLVSRLTRVAFSLYVINEAVQAVNEAFGGMFKATIGREIKLRETILKTQTTLASTNKVFRGGKEITDPYEKIVSLTGEVEKRIDSIRERSIALAGVTSNDVIEVFGIVASQVGQIGGGLKEAEDLAINFAAALGTFGIPLYQARQEIGSILRGDITTDSYLAKALGITNQDIAKAKTEVGGVVKFLETRLAASVAGQKIAAQGFSGVVSNIKDIQELVSQSFGRGLLDPLLAGLTQVFEYLFKIRKQLLDVAGTAGQAIGSFVQVGVSKIVSGTNTEGAFGSMSTRALNEIKYGVLSVRVEVSRALDTVSEQLGTLLDRGVYIFAALTKGLSDLAGGLLSLKLEQFKAMIGLLEAVSRGLAAAAGATSGFLSAWGALLRTPIAQELAQIQANAQLLNTIGIIPLIKTGFILKGVIDNWSRVVQFVITQFNMLRNIVGGVVAAIGTMIAAIGRSGTAALTAWTPAGVALKALQKELLAVTVQLETVGTAAQKAGTKLGGLNDNTGRLGGGFKDLVIGMIKFNVMMFLVEKTLGLLLERFSAWKEAQDERKNALEAGQALKYLQANYRKLGDEADYATKKILELKQAQVDEQYAKDLKALQKLQKELAEVRKAKDKLKTLQPKGRLAVATTDPTNTTISDIDAALPALASLNAQESEALQKIFGIRQRMTEVERVKNLEAAREKIDLEDDKRVNLEKEIRDLQRQHQEELFQQRQTLAQKEVEIFRAAGELRIFQMEQANQKLIEGEEGASRAALESLNNYLSVRERGELEIEAAKQNLAVEVANMERSILNYRLDMEKKIFDLRKRAGENDIASAKAREQMAGASFGSLSEIIGSRESYGGDYTAFNRGGYAQGHRAIGSGKDPNLTNMTIAEIQRRQLAPGVAKNQQLHAVGKYQIIGKTLQSLLQGKYGNTGVKSSDKFTPEIQEVLGSALARARIVPGSVNETMAGLRAEWVGLQNVPTKDLLPAVKELMAGGSAAAPRVSTAATPQLQGRSDIGDGKREAEEYAAAVRAVSTAMERLRILQKALTDAKSKEALEAIAKAAFTPVALEQYQDQLAEVQLTYEALAASSSETFDPERSKIEIDTLVKLKAAARELSQIEMAINASSLLNAQEKKRVMVAIGEQHTKYVDSLESEETALKSIQAVQRGTDAIQRLRTDTADIYKELEVTKYQNRLESEGVAPERIAAEVEKLRLKQWMTQEQTRLNEALEEQRKLLDELQKREKPKNEKDKADLQRRLDEALATIKKLQEQLGQLPKEGQKKADAIDAKAGEVQDPVESLIGRWKRELTDTKAMVASLAQTIQSELGSAMSNAVSGVINGTMTVQEAFGQMFANIGRAFIEMATQMIAKALILQVLGLFAGGTPSALVKGVDVPMAQMPAGMQFRASGGPISAGRPYIVGERGPELVFPGADGYVLPADRTAAALAQSRAALGGGGSSAASSSAFSENRDALSTATSMSRERQVERWLTSGASSTEIKYSRVGAGDLPFVTEQDMLQATRLAAQEGARMGQQRTMAALKNNPGARRTIGI